MTIQEALAQFRAAPTEANRLALMDAHKRTARTAVLALRRP